MGFGPGGGCEICDAADGCVGQSWQDVGEVIAHGDLEPTAAFDNREDCSHSWPCLFASDVDPIFPTHGYRAHGVFGDVGAQLQFRIFEESRQLLPQRKRIAARLARSALRQHVLAGRQDMFPYLIEQGWRELLAQSMTRGMRSEERRVGEEGG